MPGGRQKTSVESVLWSKMVHKSTSCNGEHTVKLLIYCWDWEQQDYSRLFGRKQSMTGLGMMCYRGDTVHGFVLSIKQTLQTILYWCLPMLHPAGFLTFLQCLSMSVTCLLLLSFVFSLQQPLPQTLPLICPQRAQLSSNQYNWVTMQLEWTLGLSSLWKMSILLPLIFCRLTVGLGSCDITFVSCSLRGLEWQNLISCRIKQFAFNLGVKG